MRTVFSYCKDNLALVNVYIKKPVVTRIRYNWDSLLLIIIDIRHCRRDQKIPMIWFVANSGGILGLCMGFSMVTVRMLEKRKRKLFL